VPEDLPHGQVHTPLKSFPITYKYGLRRKTGELELEVRKTFPSHIPLVLFCCEP
jgi:hypothetical protein